MILKAFQIKAIENLKQNFYELWRASKDGAFLTFQSLTGSGKTVIMAEFLKQISSIYNAQFDTFINNTHAENRAIVVIVDEAHLNLSTKLVQEIVAESFIIDTFKGSRI